MKILDEYKGYRKVIRKYVYEELKLPPKSVKISIRYEDDDFIYYVVTYEKHQFIAPKEMILQSIKDCLTNLPIIEKAFEFLKPAKVEIRILQTLFEIHINDVYHHIVTIDNYKDKIKEYWFEEYTNNERDKRLKEITEDPQIEFPDE